MKYAMADGRGVGQDYTPDCSMNLQIQQKYNVQGNDIHEYRKFLQQHATHLMKDFASNAGVDTCVLCPVCAASLKYKPTGNTQ